MKLVWWGGWPWRWRFYFVRRSKWGPFGELLLGPIGLTWPTGPGSFYCPSCCCDEHGERETYPTGDVRDWPAICCPLHGKAPGPKGESNGADRPD